MEDKSPLQPLPFHDDDSPEATIARIRELYGIEPTNFDQLRQLHGEDPESDHFEVFLEDLTYQALGENEEFVSNVARTKSRNLSKADQVAIVERQRALFNQYREGIIEAAGLPTGAALTDMEKSKQAVKTVINRSVEAANPASGAVNALEALGIITHDKDGREVFTYPKDLFGKTTDNKWLTYLETVKDHLRAVRALNNGTVAQSEVQDKDTVRRMAHNAVSRDVHEILGFDKLAGSDWDLEKTRNLIAKMRDSRFPTVQTAEKFVTEQAVLEGTIGIHALKTLHGRLSDMHK